MIWLILALLLCVALAGAVVAIVAVPARRDGREVLTERGEGLVATVTSKTEKVTSVVSGTAEKVRRREPADDDEIQKTTQHGKPIRRRVSDSGDKSGSPAA